MFLTRRAPGRGDVVFAVIVTVITLGLLGLLPLLSELDPELVTTIPAPSDWQWWVAVLASIGQGACLAWISKAPGRVLVAVSAIALLASLVPLGEAAGITVIPVVPAAYVATRQRAADASWLPWWFASALVGSASAVANLRLGETGPLLSLSAAVGQALAVVGLPAVAGWAAAVAAESRASREREAIARAHEMEARTQAAVATERTAIARELHDIAAHHLSGIALMSSAISQQIDTDPATAKAGLADVRAQTRELLGELRGLVALLRQDDGASVDVESLSGLEALIPEANARGLTVSLCLPAGITLPELSQGIGPLGQFAAYRTVQEALANAARHAPQSPCTVQLRDTGASLEIVVANGPGSSATPQAPSEGGFGLRGMEERAALTRSILTYGATDDGGWRVLLRVPREPGHTATQQGESS